MSGALLAGIFAGYAIAVPVGVIAVLIIETGMAGGLRRGLAAGAGAATVDLCYCTSALVIGGLLSQALTLILVPLQVLSGGVLIAIGVRGLAALWSHRGVPTANLNDPRLRGSARTQSAPCCPPPHHLFHRARWHDCRGHRPSCQRAL